jgi:hypothetical protein
MAYLTIDGPGGYLELEIDPSGSDSGLVSPPPLEQQWTTGRIIAMHPIPGRDGTRKQDQGRDDSVLTLIGICLGEDAAAIQAMPYNTNSGTHYSVTYLPDAGPAIDYPPLWLQKCNVGVRKGTSNWQTFNMTFVEQNQEDSDG